VPALRAMFNDALEDGLCAVNPFAKLGLDRSKGREDIVVLTRAELDALAQLARRMNGERFGREVAALILWAAYTRMRPGETFAARFSLLDGATRTTCAGSSTPRSAARRSRSTTAAA
jgi:integrase